MLAAHWVGLFLLCSVGYFRLAAGIADISVAEASIAGVLRKGNGQSDVAEGQEAGCCCEGAVEEHFEGSDELDEE